MTARKLAVCVLLLVALALKISAHGYVLRAIPADRSVLERPPTRLQYWFSEDLEPRFSEINLRDQSGRIIASGGVDQWNQALLALPAPPNLPDGAYIVELRPAFASDGHVIAESRVFFVGDEVGGVSGRQADDRAIPLEALWRAALNLANFLFFGASALYVAVLLPAWGSGLHEGGALPGRVMRRLRNCLAAGIALAFAASVLALLQQSMVFFNTSADQVFAQNLWQVVLIGSRFGDVWTFRLVLLIFSAVLLGVAEYYRPLMPQLAAGIWRGLPWLGALFIGLSMVTSHAAGSTLMPWLAIGVDWLHALAVAFWLGGTLALALLLPVALSPVPPPERERARRAVMRRFSTLVTPLVALISDQWFVQRAELPAHAGRYRYELRANAGPQIASGIASFDCRRLPTHCPAPAACGPLGIRWAMAARFHAKERHTLPRGRGRAAAGSGLDADRACGGRLAQRHADIRTQIAGGGGGSAASDGDSRRPDRFRRHHARRSRSEYL